MNYFVDPSSAAMQILFLIVKKNQIHHHDKSHHDNISASSRQLSVHKKTILTQEYVDSCETHDI